ncbi:MAG: hypothetical protein JWO38_4902 [Gemmataceae bacterium]|nr:hypothetical protein [Gemmataceae bacterium]
MRTYHGIRVDGRAIVTVEERGRVRPLDPGPSQRVRNHSPGGFNWGYGGSGPAQLALGLLLDASDNPPLSESIYQVFKWAFVNHWQDEWSITDRAILQWLAEIPPPGRDAA